MLGAGMMTRHTCLPLLCAALLGGCPDPGPPPPSPTPGAIPMPPGAAPGAPAIAPGGSSHPLQADLQAMPSWAYHYGPRPAASAPTHRSNVPQHRDAATFFGELSAIPSFPWHGVLACRVEVTDRRNWDARGLFGAHVEPDVTVQLTIGGDVVTARGPEDSRLAYATVPNVRLDAPGPLRVNATDRDIARDDGIEFLDLPFAPGNARIQGERMNVECRGLPIDQALQRAAGPLRDAAGANATIANLHPPADLSQVEIPTAPLQQAEDATFHAATYLGWAHPDVQRNAQAIEAARTRWAQEVQAQLEATMASLPPLGSSVDVTPQITGVHVVGANCEPHAERCLVQVQATYSGGAMFRHLEAHAITADGHRLAGTETHRALPNGSPSGRSLFVEGTLVHTFALPTAAMGPSAGPSRPRVLRVVHPTGSALLRLER